MNNIKLVIQNNFRVLLKVIWKEKSILSKHSIAF